MKEFVFGIFAALCTAAVCAADCGVCAEEKPYDFRARLADVDKPNRRDWKMQPGANELAFRDGMKIAVGEDAAPLVRRAAEDFRDYLLTSMGVNLSVEGFEKSGSCAVEVKIDEAMKEREYAIELGEKGATIRAADGKAAAQGFYRLEDRMNLCSAAFLAKGAETRRPMFSPRMSHSGWGCDQFPDAHGAQMAHYGIDAILMFVKDVDVTKSVPQIDISDTIRRPKAWGLDTYLYSYVLAFAHPADPGSKELFEKTYGRVAAAYPEAKGIIFVGESCQFPSKDERALLSDTGRRTRCPSTVK